ncbi:MAG: aminoacyl-tRNA hydrolase [Gammaproteobacteria bacterium]|nr:aminoacyl-tRNA hydrolase [Gammaproteobacteria bacterium]MBT4493585.1 aminoacyl-tRNA hydrolase [Gammaproteobacteria bacterium]MBT7371110.1 aminoacyl-tRNA hydrolase [Gammaproteobacteria bacterium]
MLKLTDIPESEIEISAIRASGPGGQHVNKVSSAIHLRFDVVASSLPEAIKQKVLKLKDSRVTVDGKIVIKAQNFRSQEKNRADALIRLEEMLLAAQRVKKSRRSTRPSKGSVRRRVDNKRRSGQQKKLRGRIDF